jgi:hypothetical protein
VVSFTPRRLYRWYPSGGRGWLGPEAGLGRYGEDTDVLFLPGIEYWLLGHRTRNLVTIPTGISCLRDNGMTQ